MVNKRWLIHLLFGWLGACSLMTQALARNLPLPPASAVVSSSSQASHISPRSSRLPVHQIAAPSASTESIPKSLPHRIHHATLEQKNIKEAAFVKMSNDLLPLSSQQIGHLRALFNETHRAAAEGGQVPPLPTVSSLPMDLAPGGTPPVVRTANGFITSLVFVDSSGAPWPIHSFSIGDSKNYNVVWDKKSNTLFIQAMSLYKRANLAVSLKNLNTPIMITLLSGQKAVDYRVDLRIPKLGPEAKASMQGLPSGASAELIKVLDGVPPGNSKPLIVEGGGSASAWLAEGRLYLRTAMNIISPGWISMVSGPDQSIHAYELPNVSVVLALYNGRVITLRIKGF